ncbi:MAG: hypothetical protein K8J08_14605 [Thermoanaerobaculia bacterium]|nr:hypothetical protein [Thermoanaerobaculia bacterium]
MKINTTVHSLDHARLVGTVLVLLLMGSAPRSADAQIRRDPNGVNVNSQGSTSVFITFGGLDNQVPVEATWCGELIPAAPAVGMKCDPSTLFGRLPIRFDQSSLRGSTFTDIMSIPPSVSRRAYQAAERGAASQFFYVRRFQSLVGGPDEYVFVTCRMAGGGARVPFALLDVQIAFETDAPVLAVSGGGTLPTFAAEIAYNGTGRLKGRWEVVRPSDDPPSSRDLLTEATLPPEERALQRRYSVIDRFNIFLPPTGKITLPGPRPELLPTEAYGLHQILLRIEASDDKEADSNLGNAGAGQGVVHSGGVAGFPMPILRYFVGSVGDAAAMAISGQLVLNEPEEGFSGWGQVDADPLAFSWSTAPGVLLYRLEIQTADNREVHAALLQQGIGQYRAPSFLASQASDGLQWRVLALGIDGRELAATSWRRLGPP